MRFEWNPRKAETNLRKHGVDFADAVTVLDDPFGITVTDLHPSEERFVTLGLDAVGRPLVVAYTELEDGFRIISARRASTSERKQYERRP